MAKGNMLVTTAQPALMATKGHSQSLHPSLELSTVFSYSESRRDWKCIHHCHPLAKQR